MMSGTAIQRFATVVLLFGGFLELGAGTSGGYVYMLLGLLAGVVGLVIELRAQ